MIEHSVSGKLTDVTTRNGLLTGKFLDRNDKKVFDYTKEQRERDKVAGDVIKVGDLLRMAELDLNGNAVFCTWHLPLRLTSFALAMSKAPGAKEGENIRFVGAVIVVFIDYTNRVSALNELKYSYKAFTIEGTEVKNLDLSVSENGLGAMELNRHGIRIVFVPTGTLGTFDFMSLMRNLVTALGFLKVSTIITDQLMVRIFPQKDLYEKCKFEKTEDFSDMDKQMKEEGEVQVTEHRYLQDEQDLQQIQRQWK
jgi:hypothetical protein